MTSPHVPSIPESPGALSAVRREAVSEMCLTVPQDPIDPSRGAFGHMLPTQEASKPPLRDAEINALHAFGSLRHANHTFEERNAAILDAAMGITHADYASLDLFEADGEELHRAAAREREADAENPWPRQLIGNDLCKTVLTSGKRQFVTEACGADPGHEAMSMQATPLLGRHGALIGVILTCWKPPFKPSSAQLQLLDLLAWKVVDGFEHHRTEAALRAGEARLKTVIAELQHRVRNILAVVRSVFSLTVESGGDFQTTINHFNGRLDALARTQVIVTRSITGTVDLETMLRDELLGAGVHDGPQVTIAGPDVALTPGLAEGVGLAIHELTTNSLKYGALAERDASLIITWSLAQPGQGEKHLDFRWSESGIASAMTNPHRRGFGRELIEQSLPYRFGATTSLTIDHGQVRCRLVVPLPAPPSDDTTQRTVP